MLRYILIKFLFDINVLPSLAVRTIELDNEKQKKKKTYYLLSYTFNTKKTKLYDLDNFSEKDNAI